MKTTAIDFGKSGGLIPAIIQNRQTREVLMLGFMNREAYEQTKETGFVYFWSRTRNTLWKKGETSGNTLRVISMRTDCDRDALLIGVEPNGVTCHTGKRSCFTGEDL